MLHSDSQSIEDATTAVGTEGTHLKDAPDAKTRRYDRQLRLWAATGQAALESARVLVLSGTATSTSVIKNLVLPGVGHFTLLDHTTVTPADAGNNFFLNGPKSIGKNRAEESVPLLAELNDGVECRADTRDLRQVLQEDPSWIKSYTLVIAHNLDTALLDRLAGMLWEEKAGPILVVVRSAGFIAEFYVQFHEQQIIETHSEELPSLRIDKPFPALFEHATKLDFANLDQTDHGHVPYIVILVRAMHDWKQLHSGQAPKTYPEKQEFKKHIEAMKSKFDEENFDEAIAQAYRASTITTVPPSIVSLFSLLPSSQVEYTPFDHLLSALKAFADEEGVLPLTSTLPDMKADTANYVQLQTLYKRQAEAERDRFSSYIHPEAPAQARDPAVIDTFVRNAHGLKVLRGKQWGVFDGDREAIIDSLAANPRGTATHLALSGLFRILSRGSAVTPEAIIAEVKVIVGPTVELPETELSDAIGEVARAPTADLPNVAAFLGGLVAQEAIKVITKQYVSINGYCVVDLVETWTSVVP